MSTKKWLLGLLNAVLHGAASFGIVILSAWTVKMPLDIKTLAMALSVGSILSGLKWVYDNPIPDDSVTITLTPGPILAINSTDKIDK